MNAAAIATLINAALQVLSTVRTLGVTNDQLKAMLESGEEVTAEDVQTSLDKLQAAIDAGRDQ